MRYFFFVFAFLFSAGLCAQDTSWEKFSGLPGGPVRAMAPSNTGELIACIYGKGVFKSQGPGWVDITNNLKAGELANLDVAVTAGGRIYLANNGMGVYTAEGAGKDWAAMNEGITGLLNMQALLITNAGELYASSWFYGSVFHWGQPEGPWENLNLEGDIRELYESSEGNIYAGVEEDALYIYNKAGEEWQKSGLNKIGAINQIAQDENGRFYAATSEGVYVSFNGASWIRKINGLSSIWVNALLIDDERGAIYAAVNDEGVFVSYDKAESWEALNSGIESVDVFRLAYNPQGKMIAATSDGLYQSSFDVDDKILALKIEPENGQTAGIGETYNFSIEVTTTQGQPVEGASVKIVDGLTGNEAELVTDDKGEALYLSTVPQGEAPGEYEISFTAGKGGYLPAEPVESAITVPDLYIDISISPEGPLELDWGDAAKFIITAAGKNSGAPIEGAKISISSDLLPSPATAVTNSNGEAIYLLAVPSDTENGKYEVMFTASKEGRNPSETMLREIVVDHKVSVDREESGISLRAWPNPCADYLLIDSDLGLGRIHSISIYAMDGSLAAQSGQQSGGQIRLDLAGLAPGGYFVLIHADKQKYALKFVKQ